MLSTPIFGILSNTVIFMAFVGIHEFFQEFLICQVATRLLLNKSCTYDDELSLWCGRILTLITNFHALECVIWGSGDSSANDKWTNEDNISQALGNILWANKIAGQKQTTITNHLQRNGKANVQRRLKHEISRRIFPTRFFLVFVFFFCLWFWEMLKKQHISLPLFLPEFAFVKIMLAWISRTRNMCCILSVRM